MARSIAVLVSVLIGATLSAASPPTQPTSKPATPQVHKNADGRFQFEAGPQWKQVPAPGKATLLLLSDGDPGPDHFRPVLRLEAVVLREKTDNLAGAGANFVAGVRRLLKESKVVEEQDVQLAGEPAKSVVISGTANDRPMKAKVVYSLHGGRLGQVYFLTREDAFDRESADVDQVVRSWKWTE